MNKIAQEEVRSALQKLPGWASDGEAIRRQFTFGSFPEAVAFIVRLGFEAEASDHHPDILVNYKRVTLTYSTHSEGGLTRKDLDGAGRASEIARTMGAV